MTAYKRTIQDYGYHIITAENWKQFEPKRATDEVITALFCTYRRRVEIPDGWELVPLHGTMQPEDLTISDDMKRSNYHKCPNCDGTGEVPKE